MTESVPVQAVSWEDNVTNCLIRFPAAVHQELAEKAALTVSINV